MNDKLTQLNNFLIFAAKNGYANSDVKTTKQADGSETINLHNDRWKLDDNYFTSKDGKRFYGREVVFYDSKPFWFVAYSGFVDVSSEPSEVYTFLKQAMLRPMKDFPVRGPKNFQDKDWEYEFKDVIGTVSEFTAKETINKKDKEVYKAYFIGGLID